MAYFGDHMNTVECSVHGLVYDVTFGCPKCLKNKKENPVERKEVVIDGVRHMMTDEQIGNLELDVSPQELEAIRLMLAREAGMPEPELYQDESPNLYYGVDDSILAQMVELQLFIEGKQEYADMCQQKLDYFKAGHPVSRDVFMAWVNAKSKAIKLKLEGIARVQALVKKHDEQYRKALWAAYFKIEDKTQWLEDWATHQAELLNPYFVSGNPEDIDEQTVLYQDQNQIADDLAASHLKEQEDSVGPRHNGSSDY